jgi:hypothetical protein
LLTAVSVWLGALPAQIDSLQEPFDVLLCTNDRVYCTTSLFIPLSSLHAAHPYIGELNQHRSNQARTLMLGGGGGG